MITFFYRSIAFATVLSFITLFYLPAFGQNQTFVYLNKKRYPVAEKDSAEYIRILTPGETSEAPYKFVELYKTGEVYCTGEAFFNGDRISLIGLITTFQKDGKKVSEEHYKEGVQEGICRYYYNNGNLKKEIIAPGRTGEGKENSTMELSPKKLVAFYDSLGIQLVKDGNGHVAEVDEEGDTEEGDYKDGYKDGRWTGTFLKRRYSYTEHYDQGKLLEGTSVDSTGSEVQYTKVEEMPTYPGGLQALYRFIATNYKYPRQAYQRGLAGAVILSFVIDAQGKVGEIKVMKDLGMGTGQEGVRVLQNSGAWVPGRMRGIPVRVSYSIPIQLNLQRG
ncbi:energy transducer TonB [Olivibacter sp. XZL3]|uniref:energy transducer TonB n=1 Tax=Olivibacter sp. XZL3 TaxID=1735116 RepID=UPI001066EDA0|nr:energy transducer TonB [Olivibacter sp. XZL3]